MKFRREFDRLLGVCEAFTRLRQDGVACVPSCEGSGLLDLGATQLAFSTRSLVAGRLVQDLLEEAIVKPGIPAELAKLRTAFEVVLSIFGVLDSGVRSCTPGSGSNCSYYVEVSPYNVMITDEGRVVIVDFDVVPGASRYLTYFDQTMLFPPHLPLDERLQECLTRSLLFTLFRLLILGAEARGPLPGPVFQLGVNLVWRGSKLDHCRNRDLSDGEIADKARYKVSDSWLLAKKPLRPEGRRPRGVVAEQVSLLTDVMPAEYREDWAKLVDAPGVLVDAITSVRDYEVPWPPKFIGSMRRWHEQLGGAAIGV